MYCSDHSPVMVSLAQKCHHILQFCPFLLTAAKFLECQMSFLWMAQQSSKSPQRRGRPPSKRLASLLLPVAYGCMLALPRPPIHAVSSQSCSFRSLEDALSVNWAIKSPRYFKRTPPTWFIIQSACACPSPPPPPPHDHYPHMSHQPCRPSEMPLVMIPPATLTS